MICKVTILGGSSRGAFFFNLAIKAPESLFWINPSHQRWLLEKVACKLTCNLTSWSFSCSVSTIFQQQHARKDPNGKDS